MPVYTSNPDNVISGGGGGEVVGPPEGSTATGDRGYVPPGGNDGQVLTKASNASYDLEWSTAGAGDVVGPAVAVNNNIAVYDQTTGKVLKDGGAAIAALATLASPTFMGTVTLPSTTSIGLVSATELSYLDGVSSALQTQLNLKATLASPTFTGTVTIPTPFTLGAVSVLPTGTELNFVDGVTSAIQTQIDAKAPLASPTFTGTVTLPTPFTLGAVSVLPTGTELNFVDGVTSAIQAQIDAKQATLISGTNIKTVGGVSILGSGDIPGGTPTLQEVLTAGAVLTGNNVINADGYGIELNSENDLGSVLAITNSGVGDGLSVQANGPAITAQSENNNGIDIVSINGLAGYFTVKPTSTNSVVPVLELVRTVTGGAGANGVGAAADFYVETDVATRYSGGVVSKWSDATDATRTSQMELFGVNEGVIERKVAISGYGEVTLDGYTQTVGGTPAFDITVDAGGKLITGPLPAPIASPTFTGTVTIPTPFTLGAVSVTPTGTELNFVDGVTSSIQTQLDLKAALASPTFTGTVVLPSTTSIGTITNTELSYVDGVTSAIQTQLDAKVAITVVNTYTVNPFAKAITALGSTIKFTSWDRTQLEITGTGAMADGQLKGSLMYVPVATTLTGLWFWQTVAGDYTAADYNGIALYSLNTSTGASTLVASSTDDGNIWKGAANVMYSKAFSSTYAAAVGWYYCVGLYNQSAVTTNPSLGIMASGQGAGLHAAGFTNSMRTNFNLTGQTTLPSSIAGASQASSTVPVWFGAY